MNMVFHESFDSTRATAENQADHPNLAQAQAEAVISLLLGRTISVSQTYAFDSRSFLVLAEAVLGTYDEARREASASAAERMRAQRPFALHRFRQPSYLAACASMLANLRDKAEGEGLRLSAWQPIDYDDSARTELARVLRTADAGGGPTGGVPSLLTRHYPGLAEHWETVIRLDEYFTGPQRDAEAELPEVSLVDYLSRLAGLDDAGLGVLARGRCPVDTAIDLRDRVKAQLARHRNDAKKAFNSRAWAHDAITEVTAARGTDAGADADELLRRELVRELVDTLYNAVLAYSGRAQWGYMSSVPRSDGRDELKEVNAFALALVRLRRDDEAQSEPTMSGAFSAAETLPNLPVRPLRQVFAAYWELVADDDRWPAWEASCERLDHLLHNRPASRRTGATSALRDAWAAHLDTLAGALPHVVRADRGEFLVAGRHEGHEYQQTHQLAALSARSMDDSLAAGEYLDGLRRTVVD